MVENRRRIRHFTGVKRMTLFLPVLILALAAGCKKTDHVPPKPKVWKPTHAQPTLPKMKIYLGAQTLDAELATTAHEEETGMMFRTNVTDQSAMLFVFPFPQRAEFWMKNCPDPLSAAYISPDGIIREIHYFPREDTNMIASATTNIGYVLEVNAGWFKRHDVTTGMLVRTEIGSLHKTFFGNRQ